MARQQVMGCLWLLLLSATLLQLTTIASAQSKCICQTSSCLCCVELNLTSSIDLGGPTCINVRQIQQNVSLNLSYGDNPVHNATIGLDLAANKPTCMNLLSDLAQICAKFVSMKATPSSSSSNPEERIHKGCLVVQPALLGTPQATYPMSCFHFEKGQVRQATESPELLEADNSSSGGAKPQEPQQDQEEDEEEEQGLNAEDLLAVVSASAEQGIALFSQWLGLNLAPKLNSTLISITNAAEAEANKNQQAAAAAAAPSASTSAANRHSRTLPLFLESEDKNDEKLKLLLSAQDNILKESATIGGSSTGVPTAFLYSQPNSEESLAASSAARTPAAVTISPENLAIVPLESRRGGRAYNIHQHVNEI